MIQTVIVDGPLRRGQLTALTGERAPTIAKLASQPRYVPGRHVDLLEEVTNFGAAPKVKLGDLCAAFDIPVKVEAHGSDVASMVTENAWDAISRYCESDVLATGCALHSWRSAQRADPDLVIDYRAALASWIKGGQPRLAHLLPYAELKNGFLSEPALSAEHMSRVSF